MLTASVTLCSAGCNTNLCRLPFTTQAQKCCTHSRLHTGAVIGSTNLVTCSMCTSTPCLVMQALRRDLRYMEQDANAFAAAMEEASDTLPTQAIQQLKGRFTFLWGMYKAHSEVLLFMNRLEHCLCASVLNCLCIASIAICFIPLLLYLESDSLKCSSHARQF